MPNKYNFPQFTLSFIPEKAKNAETHKTVLYIDDAQKKEPVMQIEDEYTTQTLYYLDNILLYTYYDNKFFVIQTTSDKNSEIYIVYNVIIGTETTHNETSVAKILHGLDMSQNQTETQKITIDFNANLRNRTILRAGNVLYAGSIITSYAFPDATNISSANLPNELIMLKSPPTGADPIKFVQEEIQWVLDCKQLGEYGNESPIMEQNNTNAAAIVISIVVATIIILGMYLLYYGFVVKPYPFLNINQVNTTLANSNNNKWYTPVLKIISSISENIGKLF